MARPGSEGTKALIVAACALALAGMALRPPAVAVASPDGPIQFEDATTQAGIDYRNLFGGAGKPYIIESTGNGAAWLDCDGDGLLDLFVVNGSTLERQEKGERGPGNRLYRNDGKGGFADVTAGSGLEGGYWGSAVATGDYDNDGLVDLYVTTILEGNHLYHNNGKCTFTDVTRASGLWNPELKSLGVVTADLDDDGWPDVYVASDSTIQALYRNRGNGSFEDVSLASGAGYSQDGRAQSGMGVDAGDYDGDGRPDLFVTTFQDDYKTLYHNDGSLRFSDVTYAARIGQVSFTRLSWGTGFQDFDNDGWLDLFVASGHVYPQVDGASLPQETYGQQNQVLRNLGNGAFADVTSTAGPGLQVVKSSRGVAFGDYDNDGRIDAVVVNMDETLTLLHNTTRTANHWLTVKTIGARSNRDGIGARVRVRAGGRELTREVKTSGSFASASDPRVHFGLGGHERVESLELRWPSGAKQTFTDVPADRLVVVSEEKGLQAAR